MYNTRNTRLSTYPLDKENEKWYSESVRTQLNMAAFDNDIAYYDTKCGLLDSVGVSITYQKKF